MTHQENNSRPSVPFSCTVVWDDAAAPSLPGRKALEVDLLNDVEGLARVYGATDITVANIEADASGALKQVTLDVGGKIDMGALEADLRRALDQGGV